MIYHKNPRCSADILHRQRDRSSDLPKESTLLSGHSPQTERQKRRFTERIHAAQRTFSADRETEAVIYRKNPWCSMAILQRQRDRSGDLPKESMMLNGHSPQTERQKQWFTERIHDAQRPFSRDAWPAACLPVCTQSPEDRLQSVTTYNRHYRQDATTAAGCEQQVMSMDKNTSK